MNKNTNVFEIISELRKDKDASHMWESAFPALKSSIFIALSVISIFGNVIDMSIIGTYLSDYVFYINALNILLAASLLILYGLNKVTVGFAAHAVMYLAVFNIFISFNPAHPEFSGFFLRETINIGILLVLGGFFNRNNILIISAIYNVYLLFILIFTSNTFLLDNAPTLVVTLVSFEIVLYFFFSLIVHAYVRQERLTAELESTNSELKQQKNELEEKSEEFRLIYENVGDFIGITDVKGRFTFLSPTIEKVLGYRPEEILGKTPDKMVYEKDLDILFDSAAKVIHENASVFMQLRHIHKDGHLVWIEVNLELLPDRQQIVGVSRDISQRKEMEVALIRANQAKDRFFSIIAHDLKNPMAQLYAASKHLSTKGDRLNEIDRSLLVQAIFDGSKRMSDLLDDLLTWSRTQMDSIKIEPAKINTTEVLKETIDFFTDQIKKKQLHVNFPKSISSVFVDESALKTIFRNLLSNAIKFSYPNGDIVIMARERGEMVELSLSDFGVGIDHKHLDDIFSMDNPYSTLGTKNEKGTGLGLIICNELAQRNRGSIVVESIKGKGTTVKLELPKVRG